MDLTNLNKDRKNKRPPAVDLDTMVYGKVPPQDVAAETAVLGAIMIERRALAEVTDLLKPEKFYSEAHQHIFRAMLSLDTRSGDIDILTVVAELKRMGMLETIGGPACIAALTNSVVSAANIATHAKQIVECWMAREVIRLGGEMVVRGYEDSQDPFELLDFAEKGIATVMDSNDRGRITPVATATVRFLQRLEKLRGQDSAMTGIPAGYEAIDNITHGWQDTDLIILAARPAVGKTAFALNLARHAALRCNIPTAFFSLEMSEGQLMERLVSAETGIWLDSIKTGRITDEQLNYMYKNGLNTVSAAPLFIDDTPALNIFELRAKCRRLKNKHQLGFIILDYLQLMGGTAGKGANREQEISQISRSLKALAKELGVPLIALSQLSRAVESRTDKIPTLADLRESGAIEQDADMVMFLYRPEYYGIAADENGDSVKGETHIKIAKHRNGTLDTVKLLAKLEIQRFEEMAFEPIRPAASGSTWRPVNLPYKDDL